MLLTSIFLLLFISIICFLVLPGLSIFACRIIALLGTGLILFLSCLLLISFKCNHYYFQDILTYTFGFDSLNLSFSFGLDGISLFFFILSNFLIFLCILFIWDEPSFRAYALTLLVIDLLLLLVFSVLDLLLFYIFFEAILIPMYLMIGIWGSRERKIRAVYFFFFYTLLGSLPMLVGMTYIYSTAGTLNFEYLMVYSFLPEQQYWLWLAFFFSFASKIPMFPFHVWLPEAHVEAPTVGSVLLAGILLKLGVYGFIRFSLNLFPEASLFFSPLVYILSLLGVIYASLTAIRQTDLKRIIAYSSVAHMNLVTIGIFSFNVIGIEGSILQSISHGFVSGAMFLLVGILYNRYHSRLLYYYSGLVHLMPIYAVLLLIFTLANIALPGTSSFVGEFLLLTGIYKTNFLVCIFATLGVILCGAYSLWLYNRIIFGNLKIHNTLLFQDITLKELAILLPLLFFVLLMGIYPKFFFRLYSFSKLVVIHFNTVLINRMLQQTNFIQTNYLSRCDLVNKYNLTTVYNSPSLTSIVLDFSLANFINVIDSGKLTLDEKEMQFKAFIWFFLFTGDIPILNSKKLSLIKSLNKKNELNFALKIKLSTSKSMNVFLLTLFIENWNRFLKTDNGFFAKSVDKTSIKPTKNKINFCVHCPAFTFYEFQNIFNIALTPINIKEFNIAINFVIQPPVTIRCLNKLNLIQNLPLFWISQTVVK